MDERPGPPPPGSTPDGWRQPEEVDPGAPAAWKAVLILLGAEAGFLVLWELAGFGIQSGLWLRRGWSTLLYVSLALLPFATILLAVGLGWVERRLPVVGTLMGLTLVGPVFLAFYLLEQLHIPLYYLVYGFAILITTPASVAAAGGLLGGLRGRVFDGYELLTMGAVLGFLLPALVMRELAMGNLADNLELRGIGIASIIGAAIFCVSVTPGFAVGSIVGGRLRHPAVPANR
jgi:hypothetical protein